MDELKPRRKRRTKAEMEAARAAEMQPTVITVDESSEETPPTEEPTKKRRTRRSKVDNSQVLYEMLETARQCLEVITDHSPYVFTAKESEAILLPLASIGSRHLPVPTAVNPDVTDAIKIAVGVFGLYRVRLNEELKQKKTQPQ